MIVAYKWFDVVHIMHLHNATRAVMRMHLMPLYQDEHCVYVQYRSDGRLRNLPLMSQSRRTVGFLYQNIEGSRVNTFAAGPISPDIRRMGSTGQGTCWRAKLEARQLNSIYTQFSCQRTLAEFWGVSPVLGLGSGPLGRA